MQELCWLAAVVWLQAKHLTRYPGTLGGAGAGQVRGKVNVLYFNKYRYRAPFTKIFSYFCLFPKNNIKEGF